MRQLITLVVVFSCAATHAAASQARAGGGTSVPMQVRACPVLTREMVAPLTLNKQMLDLFPPSEEPMGASGAACEYGSVRLQLFPTPRARQNRTPPAKDMQTLPGTGEAAYFRSNRDNFAELAVWTATHYFTLQVTVPTGKTAEAIKPDTVALAKAIIARLR